MRAAISEPITTLWRHMEPRRKNQLQALFVLMLLSGFAEVASLAAVVPFLGAMVEPERLWQQEWIQRLASGWGWREPSQIRLPLTLAFALTAILAACIRVTNMWLVARLSASIGTDFAQTAFRRTLHQPYQVHMSRNSSTVLTAMLSHVSRCVNLVIMPTLRLTVASIVICFMVIGLLVIQPLIAAFAFVFFGGFYALVMGMTRARLLRNGKLQAGYNRKSVQVVSEGLGAIRDILITRSQEFYSREFNKVDRPTRQLAASSIVLAEFPAYLIEAAGIVMIALLAYAIVAYGGGFSEAVPVLGTLALAAQRMLPAFQACYQSVSSIRNGTADVAALEVLLEQPLRPEQTQPVSRLEFNQEIELRGISFVYDQGNDPVLSSVDLAIQKGESIGLVGETGSGKSTLVDLVLGLLAPTSGEILIDGTPISGQGNDVHLWGWQANIAHVPQSIFLIDGTLRENIALGESASEVDLDRMERAIAAAQLSGFVESLALGVDTHVGERGVRLSGGQRQRVGIARALYSDATILILDEATSALDAETEQRVMDQIDELDEQYTIIMVAHRTSTLSKCDRILRLQHGRVTQIDSALSLR